MGKIESESVVNELTNPSEFKLHPKDSDDLLIFKFDSDIESLSY